MKTTEQLQHFILEVRSISRKATNGEHWLLRDISLTISPGERIAITGPSGSGKTLLLRALACLDPLDGGDILWQGKAIHGNDIPAFRCKVVYLQQRPMLMEGSVERNLQVPFTLAIHKAHRYRQEVILDWLKQLGRDETFLTQPAENLSGGESQLVALLRALQMNPTILLLDEPTAALDSASVAAVEQLMDIWWNADREQRSLVWVSHDREQVRRMTNRVLAMNGGRLEESPDAR